MATWTNNPATAVPTAAVPPIAPGVPPQARTWIGRVMHQVAVDTTYNLLIGLPLATISLSLLLVGIVLSAGLMITTLGLPVLSGTLLTARGLADLHRVTLANVLHRPTPRPHYNRSEPGRGLRRIFTPIRDSQSWLDLIAGLVDFPFAVVAFVVTVVWWVVGLGGVSTILWDWSIPYGSANYGLTRALGLANTHANRVTLNTAVGIVMLLTLPAAVRLVALLRAHVARALLCGVSEMREQIVGLQERNAGLADQKQAAAAAETNALRRIERDIHDGPQQRLVRVAMDLGRARQQMESDPDAARATIEEVLSQTRETLDELRALSRGIAPPVLTDRGLPAALAALAARSPVPIDLRLPPDLGRLQPTTETSVYFVVAETLTNIAKHSHADIAAVRVDIVDAGTVQIWTADNGVGGASVAKGHGLAGLADRVRAAGGEFELSSPAGGPTEIRAVLPCG
jgi:signal transduction histidine kinase